METGRPYWASRTPGRLGQRSDGLHEACGLLRRPAGGRGDRPPAVNPAQAIGIYDRMGSLETGKLANAAVLDQNLELKAVLFHGEIVHGV